MIYAKLTRHFWLTFHITDLSVPISMMSYEHTVALVDLSTTSIVGTRRVAVSQQHFLMLFLEQVSQVMYPPVVIVQQGRGFGFLGRNLEGTHRLAFVFHHVILFVGTSTCFHVSINHSMMNWHENDLDEECFRSWLHSTI